MNLAYKILIKTLFLFLLSVCLMIVSAEAQNSEKLRFNLNTGEIYHYKIEIKFSQTNAYESYNESFSENGSVDVYGMIELFESIEIRENTGDYAKIVCRFDSVSANLKSIAGDSTSEIDVYAAKDNIRILQNDSLMAGYTTGAYSSGAAYDFYDRLLFIGEDISMLVYPDGEIMNITENKILWEMAREMIGLPDDGLFEIILPQIISKSGGSSWEQSININKFGDFKLKEKPQSLVMHYKARKQTEFNIDFYGSLQLDMHETDVTVADLADEITLGIRDFTISKKGSAIFSGSRGVLKNMNYSIERNGDITLIGSGLENYETGLSIRFQGKVTYSLIDK
jgi:hypothetical protein